MKILVIRFSSIGDIVLTTPVLRALKSQLNDVEVHYCTKKGFKTLLEANPYIDKMHFLEDDLNALIKTLEVEKFDWVIDLHNNLRTFLLKIKLGVPYRSFEKLNWQKWFLVNLNINLLPSTHIVDRYMKTVEHLAINYDGNGLDYFIPSHEYYPSSKLPKDFQSGFVVYAIGGQHGTKKLPLTKMKELISTINFPLVLIGGKEDQENGVELEIEGNTHRKKILNFCGKLSINQSASLIQQSLKIYSHDTGMMHIAAAFRKEVISIWGNTVPEFGMYPFQTKNTTLEVKGLSCRPCSKIGFDLCPKGHFKCMNDQVFEI